MKLKTGVAPGVLALIVGSMTGALPAMAEDVLPGEKAAAETEWLQSLEARLDQDARTIAETIADDAMTAASRIDLSARLDRKGADGYQVLALAER